MTAWAAILTEEEDASIVQSGSSTGISQVQSVKVTQDQLPTPSKYGVGSNAQPQMDLAHAKQAFAQYLAGKDGHSNWHEQQ